VPVIEIRALPQPDGVDLGTVLGGVCQAVAAVLGEPASGTWATWETLAPGRYSEGGDAPALQPPSTHPPVVRVSGYQGKAPHLIEEILTTVAQALADGLGLESGNVFVRYEELAAGRVFAGGRVLGAPTSGSGPREGLNA
jgi:phenylpyruvate tautomerase PptA (4-oxalocrotonate tautomerase family)